MDYVPIQTLDELLSWEDRILSLFERSFGRPLDREVWRWMYRDNPNGLAHVTLAVEDGALVGHYAAVPTRLIINDRSAVAFRSMTTMVDPASKTPGLFLRLGSRAHGALAEAGVPLIYGFPNGNSAHTFQRFLKWTLPEPDWIVDVKGSVILTDRAVQADLMRFDEVRWALEDEAQMRWRCANPLDRIDDLGGIIIKVYQGVLNLLHLDETGLDRIEPDQTYRVLLAGHLREGDDRQSAFPYQFGYRWLSPVVNAPSLRPELIMSDVF